MSDRSFLSRLKSSRLVRVLLVYLGASWVVLQVAEILQEALALPDWLLPAVIVLLLAGLVVIMATAWVQSHPMVDEREAAGEVPDSWEVAFRDLGRSVKEGRLPHLTWGRALVGGLFAFWLLFGFAGLYVVISDRGESFAPGELVADEAGTGIAVLPFTASGADPEFWREGMLTILSTTLDGVAGFRAIDSRTVMARWREAVPGEEDPDLSTVLSVARSAGGRYALVGSAVGVGSEIRLVADVHDVESGREVGTASVEGSPDSVMTLVDRLSVEVIQTILEAGGEDLPTVPHASSLTTSSMPALRAYLEGEAHFRQADFVEAVQAYERAIAEDSTFALASARAGLSWGWISAAGVEEARVHRERALRHADRLPARERILVRGTTAQARGDLEAFEILQDGVRRFPDDPELWYALGEAYVHMGEAALADRAQVARTLSRAVELDPGFGPYHIHLVEYYLHQGDTVEARRVLEREETVAPGSDYARAHRLAFDLAYGDSAARASASVRVENLEFIVLRRLRNGLHGPPVLEAKEAVLRELVERPESGTQDLVFLVETLVKRGRLRAARSAVEEHGPLPDLGLDVRLYMARLMDRDRLRNADPHPDPVARLIQFATVGDSGAYEGARAEVRVMFDSLAARDPELEGVAEEIFALAEGVSRLEGGRPAEAIPLLERVETPGANSLARWYLALAHEALGQPREALRYHESYWSTGFLTSLARFRKARLYEELGQTDEAREAYRSFLVAWKDADPGLPHDDEARAALERLGG